MRLTILTVSLCLAACGGSNSGGSSSPTTPTPAAPAANRAPTISNVSITPSFGIADLQMFTLASTATDPDGDVLTSTWTVNDSQQLAGGTVQFRVPSPGGSFRAILTVSDGRGGSTSSDPVVFIAGSLSGVWTGTMDRFPITLNMQQSGTGTATADWSIPGTPVTGNLDPAVFNRVESSGRVVLRCKVRTGGSFSDFTLEGQLQQDGRTITGGVFGSGFAGNPFRITR